MRSSVVEKELAKVFMKRLMNGDERGDGCAQQCEALASLWSSASARYVVSR